MAMNDAPNVVALVGGVGGAKLALGLAGVLPPERLTVIVNTGDDFWHYGLRICPDLDTVLYTLSGRVDPAQGWGVAQDTVITLEALRDLGEDTWFRLGDRDIATHLLRTHLLREGLSLTAIVRRLSAAMSIGPAVLPMSDDPVATMVDTAEYGELDFQTYFVRHRWQPRVRSLRYACADESRLAPAALQALEAADIVLIAPSNPWLSIAPMLALPGMRDLLRSLSVPRVAVTPIVEGGAIKGPAAKIMAELGLEVSARTVAAYYRDVINGFVFDLRDAHFEIEDMRLCQFDTIMKTPADKQQLAQKVLDWIREWEV